jgi:hypothetical protein
MPLTEARGASGERSVDTRAQVTIDDRALIGKLEGGLTLPGTKPLATLGPRKRVQSAMLDISMTMGNSRLIGTLRGSLKQVMVPQDPYALPPGTIPRAVHSQSAPSQNMPPPAGLPASTGPGTATAKGAIPQVIEPKLQGYELTDPKLPTQTKVSNKRKKDQTGDLDRVAETSPSAKRRKPGHKPKGNKGENPKSRGLKDLNEKESKMVPGAKSKNKKEQGKRNEGKDASTAVGEMARQMVSADGTSESTKPKNIIVLKVKNSDRPVDVPAADPNEARGEDTQEKMAEGREEEQDKATKDYLGEDFAPPQPPQKYTQPPARTKPQRPPKPPPREGTRKNPPRTGKK